MKTIKFNKLNLLLVFLIALFQLSIEAATNSNEAAIDSNKAAPDSNAVNVTSISISNHTDYPVELSVEQESTWGSPGSRARRWTTLDEKPAPGETLKGSWKDWASGTKTQNDAKLKIADNEINFKLNPSGMKQNYTINAKDRTAIKIEITVVAHPVELTHWGASFIKNLFNTGDVQLVSESFYNYDIIINQIEPKSKFSLQ